MIGFLLAGGEGSRLWPITTVVPKPLVPIRGKPILSWIIENIDNTCDLEKLILCINERFKDQFEWNLRIQEGRFKTKISATPNSENLGTAGELLAMRREIDDDFLIHYGDILTNLNMGKMIDFHLKNRSSATLAILPTNRIEKGIVEMNDDQIITGFIEKPDIDLPNWCGIGIFGPEVMRYIKIGYDLSGDVLPAMLANNEKITAYMQDGFWYLDIGSISSYLEADKRLAELSYTSNTQ